MKNNNLYKDHLLNITNAITWFYVEDIGSYSGTVYGVGVYGQEIIMYEDYYGSCPSCGEWGSGSEPKSLGDILDKSKLFRTPQKAILYLEACWLENYDKPDKETIVAKINEAYDYITKWKNKG